MKPAHLLSPLSIGPFTLPNRVIMGSMHTNLEDDGEAGAAALAAFYAERAAGGAALLVTGGYGPNPAGRMKSGPGFLNDASQLPAHQPITEAVHAAGGRIVLQILHSGRYALHPDAVAPSAIRAPISRVTPRELSDAEIHQTIADYAQCAALAVQGGYDGVEVMGSEGYLLTQFTALRTNQRTDDWGGSLENRLRFPVEVVKAVRAALGPDKLLMYRLSVLDLVDGALSFDETVLLAQQLIAAGVDVLSTGIGWHEAPVPTVQQVVPPALFSQATAGLRQALRAQGLMTPICASNRIPMPDVAESLLAATPADAGACDLVALARPLLADPAWVNKAAAGQADSIVPCIACNQACLDHYFTGARVSCLVNPLAGRELELALTPASKARRVAVVGGGCAGLAAALAAARRGHQVTLFEARAKLGGQFRLAAAVPGKQDYAAVIDAYARLLDDAGVQVKLGVQAHAADLQGFDRVVIASGIAPRQPDLPGIDLPHVIGYEAVLDGSAQAQRRIGKRVAIIGAGGIGFDVALTLLGEHAAHTGASAPSRDAMDQFTQRWLSPGALPGPAPARQIWMFKRSTGAFGATLGKTTGWVLRRELASQGVTQIAGASYTRITAAGLDYEVDGVPAQLDVDTVVICAGQQPALDWLGGEALDQPGWTVIGGAEDANALDAKRAFEQGWTVGRGL